MKKCIALVLALVLMFSLVACTGEAVGDKTLSPSETVDAALTCLVEGEHEEYSEFMYSDEQILSGLTDAVDFSDFSEEDLARVADMVYEHLEFEVNSEVIDGVNAVVEAEITNADMNEALKAFVSETMGMVFGSLFGEEAEELNVEGMVADTLTLLEDCLTEYVSDELVTTVVSIPLVQDEAGNWLIVGNDEFSSALLGGADPLNDAGWEAAADSIVSSLDGLFGGLSDLVDQETT